MKAKELIEILKEHPEAEMFYDYDTLGPFVLNKIDEYNNEEQCYYIEKPSEKLLERLSNDYDECEEEYVNANKNGMFILLPDLDMMRYYELIK
jgi:hypothetical protein